MIHMPRKKQTTDNRKKRLSLLAQLADEPEKLFSGAFRQQYGAVCFRYVGETSKIEVHVNSSRETGRWIVPKGWPMKKKKSHEAAAIEAWEEAGVKGAVHKTAVVRYTYLKFLDNGDVVPTIVDLFQTGSPSSKTSSRKKGSVELPGSNRMKPRGACASWR
jgi:hypothetical protein